MELKSLPFIFLLFLASTSVISFAQPGPDWVPCDVKQLGSFRQLTDSIDFRAKCATKINFEIEACSWSIAEGYFNTVPVQNAKLLCIVYFEGIIESEELLLMDLFDDPKTRKKYLDKIQLIFIYEPTSGFNQPYQEKEKIAQILQHDLRKGFNMQNPE